MAAAAAVAAALIAKTGTAATMPIERRMIGRVPMKVVATATSLSEPNARSAARSGQKVLAAM